MNIEISPTPRQIFGSFQNFHLNPGRSTRDCPRLAVRSGQHNGRRRPQWHTMGRLLICPGMHTIARLFPLLLFVRGSAIGRRGWRDRGGVVNNTFAILEGHK